MKKVMISQPMNGLTTEQIKTNREQAVKLIESQHCEVVDSIFDFEDVSGIKNKPLFYLAKSFQIIAREVDAVYFLARWEQSRGCVLEHAACLAYGIPVFYEVLPDEINFIK